MRMIFFLASFDDVYLVTAHRNYFSVISLNALHYGLSASTLFREFYLLRKKRKLRKNKGQLTLKDEMK